MPAKFLPSLVATVAASFLLSGCQLPTQQTDKLAPFGSVAQITSISPDTTQVLRAGQQVRLRVDVSHVLTTESGTVTLVVLAADNSGLGHDFKAITKGSGKSTLEAQFTVPRTTVIRVFTPLIVQGEKSTSVVDGREFEVAAN